MSLILSLVLQVGPDPMSGAIPGVPDELLNRPPRRTETAPSLDPTSLWLSQCLDTLDEDPAQALIQARTKRDGASQADRVVANHCLGLSATELGQWNDALIAFLAARDETPSDEPSARARFGTMAGNAALASGNSEGALSILDRAREDARTAASATLEAIAAIDSARALVTLGRNDEALTALQTATTLEPNMADGWFYTATLLRRMERLDEAQSAIERAVALAPQEVDIGLEAGVIAVLSGREEAARQSWRSVIETQPDSLAAQTAQEYLAQLGPASVPATEDNSR